MRKCIVFAACAVFSITAFAQQTDTIQEVAPAAAPSNSVLDQGVIVAAPDGPGLEAPTNAEFAEVAEVPSVDLDQPSIQPTDFQQPIIQQPIIQQPVQSGQVRTIPTVQPYNTGSGCNQVVYYQPYYGGQAYTGGQFNRYNQSQVYTFQRFTPRTTNYTVQVQQQQYYVPRYAPFRRGLFFRR